MKEVMLFDSPLGEITICFSGNRVLSLFFSDSSPGYFIEDTIIEKPDCSFIKMVEDNLKMYFAGEIVDLRQIPFILSGSKFQKRVYKLLLKQTYGTVTTYGELAQKFEMVYRQRMSPQAIGGALKNNPLLLIVPCHRIIKKDGPGGYSAGVKRKLKLLKLEGINLQNDYFGE